MSDITMCSGTECPLKEGCYRHKATPSGWQSYFASVPYDIEEKTCKHYWPEKEAN